MEKKYLKKRTVAVLLIKIALTSFFFFFAIIFIEDILTIKDEVSFPWEAGGFFYTSFSIYVLSGIFLSIINLLPFISIIIQKTRKYFFKVSLFVLIFDILYIVLINICYEF